MEMLNITLQEGSEFFRGLLLLIRKDQKITEEEKELLMSIGKTLGFAPTFCTIAVNDILDNKFISENPPIFSSKEIAKNFIHHGLVVSYSDKEIHKSEMDWLLSVAQYNDIDAEWVLNEKEKLMGSRSSDHHIFEDMIRFSIN